MKNDAKIIFTIYLWYKYYKTTVGRRSQLAELRHAVLCYQIICNIQRFQLASSNRLAQRLETNIVYQVLLQRDRSQRYFLDLNLIYNNQNRLGRQIARVQGQCGQLLTTSDNQSKRLCCYITKRVVGQIQRVQASISLQRITQNCNLLHCKTSILKIQNSNVFNLEFERRVKTYDELYMPFGSTLSLNGSINSSIAQFCQYDFDPRRVLSYQSFENEKKQKEIPFVFEGQDKEEKVQFQVQVMSKGSKFKLSEKKEDK
ncbi:Hypothetical_protein [Hexamita inflata]|uniref:Hypothetical_protein n=1 Tax=Hexamita inflata TaxID=28002 RepID=A0AA86PF90_9EUKA|nr:Hypothetical protein HINF_LOCUS25940 [Hexamita inflata]